MRHYLETEALFSEENEADGPRLFSYFHKTLLSMNIAFI